MVDYQYVTKKEVNLDQTVNIRKLIGKRVLSSGGVIVGMISEVRVNFENLELEGIVVKREFEKPIYIGRAYFSTLSMQSVILNTELSILLKGKKVITLDGMVLGRVTQVNRKGTTNEIESLIIRSWWRKYLIPESEIKQIASSVTVKRKYDATKVYLWKRLEQSSNV
ncbi:MAG: PRC-barrel domain-containing protein [Nanoarchaeota archaeon]